MRQEEGEEVREVGEVLENALVNLEEVRQRLFNFFRTACRSLPSVMETYNLYDVASVS